MTASDDGELVSTLLMVMALPQLLSALTFVGDAGIRVLTNAEAKVLTFIILPIVGFLGLATLVMIVGYWIDAGGLDI